MEVVQQRKRETKLKRWQKVSLIFLGVFIVLIISALIFVNGYINRSLPQIEGNVSLAGLTETVEVIRDGQGVPHINANTDRDLFMAQGYIQAQDRLFQMDMARRQASGRLSELAGEVALERDKYFRTLGLRRAAEKSYQSYSEDAKQVMEWYATGVNRFIEQAKSSNSLPIEFTLMGGEPEKWTPIDSLTIGKYMAFDLGGHWERQAFNYFLLQNLPEEKANELFPTYPNNAPTIMKEEEVNISSLLKEAVLPHPFNGSNNWVVSGDKTASGKPLLADDPHLGLATPSIWYQMHLSSPNYEVSGVIFAGIPGIILGHNQNIAWGVTNTGPDVQQLYLEKRNPDNPNQFLFEGEYEEATVINEDIKVKDRGNVDYEVIETRHGPIISEFAKKSGKETALSLRWTALDASTELEAILEINQATNWKQFEEGLEKFLVPAQNFVFASKDGTIAYKANGKIPIYEEGSDALLPLEGWKEENEWKNFIPFDELPTVVNPDKGFIATANNKVVGDEYPYHISNNWAQPYRYQRIEEVLQEKNKLTTKDMKELQMDQKDLRAQEFVPIFLEQVDEEGVNDYGAKALQLLRQWNYVDDVEAPEPLIFNRWMKAFSDRLYEEQIPEGMMEFFKGRGQTTDELIRKVSSGENVTWIEDQGGLSKALTLSLNETITDLIDEHGKEITSWEWGDFHKVEFTHPLSSVAFLDRFFNPKDPKPVGGSKVTVMAASYDYNEGIVDHGASWRFVADLNDLSSASHLVGPGQSGHFRSKWYHSQWDNWVNGGYHETKTKDYQGKQLMLQPE
ncbi:penicillin acylase family protein [Pontibacillus yanchengensis]|uniref:Beta-lactam antibiotic acylase n=1 Tax=Pontibacillus yanchengensis Y32 TaxID=1385514 RepID=A0A0A2T716_9BACI|nr:penicillin acylase family protein [Pontibacillus yanchengensis]KGP71607.1 beta-lactam antibiotic acylase [Pontibacillus yanchengensis Y32]